MPRFKQHLKIDSSFVSKKLNEFFNEDNIDHDITTQITQINNKVQAQMLAKEKMIFAGKEIIKQGFSNCKILNIINDGTLLTKGAIIANIQGPIKSILKRERVILNLIQRLCGIASATHYLSEKTKKQALAQWPFGINCRSVCA